MKGVILMAKAHVKDGVLYVECVFVLDGKKTTSRKNVIHSTTEPGTPDALTFTHGGKKITVQLNAYSAYEKQEAPAIK